MGFLGNAYSVAALIKTLKNIFKINEPNSGTLRIEE